MSYIGKQPTKAPLTASDIEDGIITAAKIEDGAVVAAEIASNAVTTAKINADAVTAAKIADNAVGTAAINADAVTGAKIADDAINSEHYTDGSIDTAHLADGQVTTAKLSTAVFTGATDIGADIADADLFLLDDGAGGTIRKSAASRLKTYIGSTGKVLQVVTVQDTTVRSTTSTSYTKASNGYDLNITPTASNSNILLEASFGGGIAGTGVRCHFTIFRDSTDIGTGDGVTTHEITNTSSNARSSEQSQHLLVVDSPNSTSQITYSIQMKSQDGSTVYMNQKGVGCFVAYEIAG